MVSACAPASGLVSADYDLYTHCGIRHIVLDGVVYLADPVLDDGNGNPPPGWGNPIQPGRLAMRADGSATFTSGSLVALFIPSDLSVAELPICS